MSFEVKDYVFNLEGLTKIRNTWFGSNWPIVYILYNDRQAYIGETSSIKNRLKQHLDNSIRIQLKSAKIISDKRFNKSAVLDIESKLIEYFSADGKYILQNSNFGLRNHRYYEKNVYEAIFKEIWKKLKEQKFVKNDLRIIENSDLFKYTPYKNLTDEQYDVIFNIVLELLDSIENGIPKSIVINGEAGTGKTVLAMYLLKLISDDKVLEFASEFDEEIFEQYKEIASRLSFLNIGLVIPMNSLRNTLRKIVKKVDGLSPKMIIGPTDVVKNDYNILLVDESHRLKQRKNLTGYGSFDNVNKHLGLGNDGTELDWILKSSPFRVFFYDEKQTIRKTDIPKLEFQEKVKKHSIDLTLTSQLRVLAGNDYIKYVKAILSDNPPIERVTFEPYEFFLVESISDLKSIIQNKERINGLSRLISGYGFEWKSKKNANIPDIVIDGESFFWNRTNNGWINSINAINEVGSIHTTQGYDLNYVGLIFGPEIDYDPIQKRLIINRSKYFDSKGKADTSDSDLHNYIINIYGVLMTRAIKGTFVYVVNKNLRDYLSQFIPGS